MRTSRILSLLAVVMLASSAACDGGGDLLVPDTMMGSVNVVGEWVAAYPASDGAHTEERMKFGASGSYSSEVLWIGFYGRPADEVTGYLRTQGRYRMEGDRLMLLVTRVEEWQKYAVGPNPSLSTPDPVWAGRGTLEVEGDRLIHTFVAAPLDAPETFTQVYQRER